MPGMAQYQGSQVQGSYVNPTGPIDVTGPGQELARGAEALATVFQRSGEAYQKYEDVHNRTRFNEKQIEYNAHLRQGLDKIEAEIGTIPTKELKAEKLEQTLGNYVKPYQEFLGDEFDDNAEMKSRLELVYQSKYFQAQGQWLSLANKELSARHLKNLHRASDSIISETASMLDDGKVKKIISEYKNSAIKAAIADGVIKPWEGDKEVKRIYQEWLTTKFDSDYETALQQRTEDQFLKDYNSGKYKVTYKNFSGEEETIGLNHGRVRGTLSRIKSETIGRSRKERKALQISEYELEIEQRPDVFLEKYGKEEDGIWVADQEKFTDELLEGSDQNKLIRSAFSKHEADQRRKKENAVPLTKNDEERFYINTADFFYQEELFDPAGNKDPTWEFEMQTDEQKQTYAQIRSFAQLAGQMFENLEDASPADLREYERQLQAHMNRDTESGSKVYKQKIYEQFNTKYLAERKAAFEEAPADLALSDLIDETKASDIEITQGTALLPFDALLEKQKKHGTVAKDSKVIAIPQSFKDEYRKIHESPDDTSIFKLNTRFETQYGTNAELMKREYIRELTKSNKGNDAEFGAVWMMGENLSPSTKSDLMEGLRTKAEAVQTVPSQLSNIQKWSARNGSILRILPESNQKGAIIKAIDFMAKTRILNLNDPNDEDNQYFEVDRVAKEILFGATPSHGWVYSKDGELGSGLIAKNSMWKELRSDEKGKDLSHAALVGKLHLTPENIDFGELRFPGWDEKQVKDFYNRIIYSDVEVKEGMLGLGAVVNPLNANSWIYGLVHKRPGSDTPELIAPVRVDETPLIYTEEQIQTELLPARHKLEYLEELVPWKMLADKDDLVKKPKLSFTEIQELVQEEINPSFKNKMIVAGQKWFIDNIGVLEQEVLTEVLIRAESESDEHVFDAIVEVASEYGGMESSWSRFTGKWFDTRPKSSKKEGTYPFTSKTKTTGELLYKKMFGKKKPSVPVINKN